MCDSGLTIHDCGFEHDQERKTLEDKFGQVWDTKELGEDFTVHSFAAPFISVTRKNDGVNGMLEFQHRPRFYYSFTKDS